MEHVTFGSFANRFLPDDVITKIDKYSVKDLLDIYPNERRLAEIKEALAEGPHEQSSEPLIDPNNAISLILYWHQITSGDGKSPEEICTTLKERCKWVRDDHKARDALRVMLAQSCHEMYFGLKPSRGNDAALSILSGSHPITNVRLPSNTRIDILVPIVPVVSVFSLYILTLVNLVLKKFTEHIESLRYVWNTITYARIKREILKSHFKFAPTWEPEEYFHISEQKFLSFANSLLLCSNWDRPELPLEQRIKLLAQDRVNEDPVGTTDGELRHQMLIKRYKRDDLHKKSLVVGSLGDYLGSTNSKSKVEEDLISLYAALIADWNNQRRQEGEERILFFIGRLPDLVLTDDILEDKEKEGVYMLAYLPFPFERETRRSWPFYVNWYSPFAYEQPTGKGISDVRREYMRALLASILKELDLDFLRNVSFETLTFEKAVAVLTESVFQRLEDQIDRQLEYII